MPQDDSLVNRLKRSAMAHRIVGDDYHLVNLLEEAASAIQILEGKLGPQDRPEGSTRGLMAT